MNAVVRGQNHRYQIGGGQTATSQKKKPPKRRTIAHPIRRRHLERGRIGVGEADGAPRVESVSAEPRYLMIVTELVRTSLSGIGSGIMADFTVAFP